MNSQKKFIQKCKIRNLAKSDDENMENKMKALATYYAEQNPDSNFQVVYGDQNNLKSLEYDQDSNEVKITDLTLESGLNRGLTSSDPQEITLSVPTEEGNRVQRKFKVGQGKNFYILMRKKIKNEKVVISRGGASS